MQHLDEGTIHAWLDGQLPRDEATTVEAHVAECRQCADAVAEARGLIAASSRILTALDGAPRGVVPSDQPIAFGHQPSATEAPVPGASTPATHRARRRWFSGPSLAAAATIIVAIGTFTVIRGGNQDAVTSAPDALTYGDRATEAAADTPGASAASVAVPPPAAPAPQVAGSDASNAARLGGSADERRSPADGRARREQDQAAIARTQPVPSAPAVAQKAEVDERQVPQRSDFAKKAGEQVVATAAPRPDTARVEIIRGAKAEASRLMADSAARDVSTAAAVVASGTVRGRVTDANRTPLGGALVQVAGTSAGVTTSPSGEFELRGVPTGTQRITARRVGYAADTLGLTIAVGQPATADFILVPDQVSVQSAVVTAQAEARSQRGARAEAPPSSRPAESSTAYGCYDLGITPATSQARSDFRQVPRRIALDSTVVPGRSDGVWYQARDLTGTIAPGIWRPTSAGSIEVQWTYGTRTATIRLTGVGTDVLRGHASEIDSAAALGASAPVVAAKTRCGG